MKLSLAWLKEFVQLPSGLTPAQLMHDLTMSTVEVEKIHDLASSLKNICVGQIRTLAKHPNADRLTVCTVDLGTHGVREIVCGGTNLRADQLVAVAIPGALVHWHGAAELAEVKDTKIRGQASWGMICASEEIGLKLLFPASAEHEIIDLAGFNAEPGRPLAEALDLNDTILEIDNKSLSNRPDLWGHYGIARELSALYDCPLTAPQLERITFGAPNADLRVEILEPSLCSRYTGLAISGVKNAPSPYWLRSRLSRVGLRSISLLVDLTNYVMMTVGQPTHVFDARTIAKRSIVVRHARANETLTLLDGTTPKLDEQTLIVADAEQPVALAGIMGGLGSSVQLETESIIFESANFNSIKIRKAVGQFGIRTDSSMRFEKAQDPFNAETASQLFLTLLRKLQPQIKVTAAIDHFPTPPAPKRLEVGRAFLESRLGSTLDTSVALKKLGGLGFVVALKGDTLSIEVPSHRATGDVSSKEDIVEEIARMLGYDNLRSAPIPVHLAKAVSQSWYQQEKKTREFLVSGGGLFEVINYPWISDQLIAACGLKGEDLIELMESPGPNCSRIRSTLLPGILETIAKNCNHKESFGVFELGSVFFRDTQAFSPKSARELLPRQQKSLALALVGKNSADLFLDAKGILRRLCAALHLQLSFQAAPRPTFPCDGAISIVINSTVVGTLMIPSAKVLQASGIKRVKVALAELDFSTIRALVPIPKRFTQLPKFPTVDFDIAAVFADAVTWESIEALVRKSNPLIEEVQFIDQYRGDQIPQGKKSIALRMKIVPREKTLTSDEIGAITDQVIGNLKRELQGELRGG